VTQASRLGLNWLNLLVSLMQTGLGAFLSVYLARNGWSSGSIGVALSTGAVATLLAQVPGGMLVDAAPSKRQAAAVAILLSAVAVLAIAAYPARFPVIVAEAVQGVAAAVLAPAVAAITLALTHQDALGERFGHNARFAALGSVAAAAVMGLVGTWSSHLATLFLAAAAGLAALPALFAIPQADIAAAPTRTAHRGALPSHLRPRQDRARDVVCDPCLIVFSLCMALFFLGNAALFPLAAAAIARTGWQGTELVVAAGIIAPQLITAALSPRVGRLAETIGRRRILIAGFAAMVLRALLLAFDGSPWLMIAFQALDGISASVIGVLVPLTVADITHHRGRFNLAMGVVGLVMGIGSAASTTLGGAIAQHWGNPAAFLAMAFAGMLACLLAWTALPETRHRLAPRPA
jgi:MFS family permease